ncbi:MAG TPA: alpha/beta hydrolase [Sphingomicrobium sp.]
MKNLILAAALAATALPLPVAAQPAAVTAAAEERMDHVSLSRIGSGSPVVLIPGLSSPRAVWSEFVPALARNHAVYLVQVNGFAGDAPGGNLEPAILEGIIADLSSRLERDRTGPARIVGHSLGGLVALKFAHAHPEQVDQLMIVDALPYFAALLAPGGEAPSPAMVEPIARSMRDRVAARHGQPVDEKALQLETARLALRPESQARIVQWAARADQRVTAQLLYEDMTTDLRPVLAEIRATVTIVYPWIDKAVGKDQALAFYQREYAATPTIRYVGIADAGHFVMLDQPDAFAAVVSDFVE